MFDRIGLVRQVGVGSEGVEISGLGFDHRLLGCIEVKGGVFDGAKS